MSAFNKPRLSAAGLCDGKKSAGIGRIASANDNYSVYPGAKGSQAFLAIPGCGAYCVDDFGSGQIAAYPLSDSAVFFRGKGGLSDKGRSWEKNSGGIFPGRGRGKFPGKGGCGLLRLFPVRNDDTVRGVSLNADNFTMTPFTGKEKPVTCPVKGSGFHLAGLDLGTGGVLYNGAPPHQFPLRFGGNSVCADDNRTAAEIAGKIRLVQNLYSPQTKIFQYLGIVDQRPHGIDPYSGSGGIRGLGIREFYRPAYPHTAAQNLRADKLHDDTITENNPLREGNGEKILLFRPRNKAGNSYLTGRKSNLYMARRGDRAILLYHKPEFCKAKLRK
jgi:hypothetical protein